MNAEEVKRLSQLGPQNARLYKKGEFAEAKRRYVTHALSENRNGLAVDAESTRATGRAEREAAIPMIDRSVRKPGETIGADKGYLADEFVAALERRGIKAHVWHTRSAAAPSMEARRVARATRWACAGEG